MAGETPELTLQQPPQDASTKKLSECLRRIGDELDSNMELQRCGSWELGPSSHFLTPQTLGHWALLGQVFLHWAQIFCAGDRIQGL